ncbi:MAG: COX15/CtaA family protein [Parvibaculum sp.]
MDTYFGLVPTEKQIAARRAISIWLLCVAALVALIVVVGGATRLTDSGLSITEWKPVTGAIPPLSQEVWEEEFAKYQLIPEYIRINRGMSLDEFKSIYWWEWGHRFLGRLVGLVFFVPFMVFVLTKRVERSLLPHLAAMFVLGGMQGVLGWYMVMSGLTERVDVSQYRLAAHLGLAFFVFGYLFWAALSLWRRELPQRPGFQGRERIVVGLGVLIYLQIIAGAFVAGLDAGFAFNTWPLMDGDFIPRHLYPYSPFWVSLFEDVRTVQFNHRMFAYLITALIVAYWWRSRGDTGEARRSGHLLLGALGLQVVLGIVALLSVVQIHVALMHQFGAVVLLTTVLYHHDVVRRARASG